MIATNLHAQAIAINCVMVSRAPQHETVHLTMCEYAMRLLNTALTALHQTRSCLAECRELVPYLKHPELEATTHAAIIQLLAQACIGSQEPYLLAKLVPAHKSMHLQTATTEAYDVWFREFWDLRRNITSYEPPAGIIDSVSAELSLAQIAVSAQRLGSAFLKLNTDLRLQKNALEALSGWSGSATELDTTTQTTNHTIVHTTAHTNTQTQTRQTSPHSIAAQDYAAKSRDNLAAIETGIMVMAHAALSAEQSLSATYHWLLAQNIMARLRQPGQQLY